MPTTDAAPRTLFDCPKYAAAHANFEQLGRRRGQLTDTIADLQHKLQGKKDPGPEAAEAWKLTTTSADNPVVAAIVDASRMFAELRAAQAEHATVSAAFKLQDTVMEAERVEAVGELYRANTARHAELVLQINEALKQLEAAQDAYRDFIEPLNAQRVNYNDGYFLNNYSNFRERVDWWRADLRRSGHLV